MSVEAFWKWLAAQPRLYRAQLRFAIRVTVAAISALVIADFLALPLHGLWVIITATVITQLSAGGSLRAGVEYVLGTLGGAIVAAIIGLLFPLTTIPQQCAILAITVAPLAFLAALNPNLRAAPFSAVLVLLLAKQIGEGPIASALIRFLEVALGGSIAVIVSFLIFPERAQRLASDAAARTLVEMAKDLPEILAGFFRKTDERGLGRIHDRIGQMVAELQVVAEEMKRERPISFTSAPDPAPLPRTLLRLRHDLVMMGRASLEPLPDHLREILHPAFDHVGAAVATYFRSCGAALNWRHAPPPLQPVDDALASSRAQIAASCQSELAQLSPSQLQQLFALGFALEQFGRNVKDLERCIQEWVLVA